MVAAPAAVAAKTEQRAQALKARADARASVRQQRLARREAVRQARATKRLDAQVARSSRHGPALALRPAGAKPDFGGPPSKPAFGTPRVPSPKPALGVPASTPASALAQPHRAALRPASAPAATPPGTTAAPGVPPRPPAAGARPGGAPKPKAQPPRFDGLVDASERWLNSLPAGRGAPAAFARYRRAAKRGDAVAMANMAACLEAGRGCRRDPAAAWRCWIAAAHGSDEGIRQTVARRLLRGEGVKRDRGLARQLLAFGGHRGDARSQLALGEDLIGDAGTPAELLTGLRWLARAALNDQPGAAAAWLRHAEALPADARALAEADLAALARGKAKGAIARAAALGPGGAIAALAEAGGGTADVPRLLERAAAHDPAAMVRLAKGHQGDGAGVQATAWYRRAAARGRVDAMLALGAGDDAEALGWLRQAARAGSPVAMRRLGDRLAADGSASRQAAPVADVEPGAANAPSPAGSQQRPDAGPAGVSASPPAPHALAAASAGAEPATTAPGADPQQGAAAAIVVPDSQLQPGPATAVRPPIDLPLARRWYEAAASRGDLPALLALAQHAESPEAAARWWGLAARRQAPGAADAHAIALSALPADQQGRVARDMATWALRHPRAAIAVAPPADLPAGAAGEAARLRAYAQAGAAWAQTALGHALAVGKVVPPDQAEAATWWLRAAQQGDRLAQANLAEAYAAGRGLPRDDAFAYAWWCLATDRDPAGGQAGYPYATRLTAAQVAQAAQLAADWRRRASDLPEEPAP